VLTVRRWRRRYRDKGVEGLLKDASRPPGRKPLSAEAVKKVVDMTLNSKPRGGTHWSVRSMAKASGISPAAVQRIWAAHGLKPHLTRTQALPRPQIRRQARRRCRPLLNRSGIAGGCFV
jgi:transposase